ncbi:hypothetical protein EDD85DRAFT_795588 [Armillaria nabsnona]|nr:hypothetical protein EDD85DRAFT_795588 [Armillaria nabsnona]
MLEPAIWVPDLGNGHIGKSGAAIEGDDGKRQTNVSNVGANDQQTTLILYHHHGHHTMAADANDELNAIDIARKFLTLAVKSFPASETHILMSVSANCQHVYQLTASYTPVSLSSTATSLTATAPFNMFRLTAAHTRRVEHALSAPIVKSPPSKHIAPTCTFSMQTRPLRHNSPPYTTPKIPVQSAATGMGLTPEYHFSVRKGRQIESSVDIDGIHVTIKVQGTKE